MPLPRPRRGPADPRENTILARVDVLLDIGVESFETVEPLVVVAPDGLTAPVSGGVWVFPRCLPLNLRVVELRREQVEVTALQRVVSAPDDLHVLLRNKHSPALS